MLYELETKDYALLEPLLTSGFQFPEVIAVADLINSGWIVTDDPAHPVSALLWAEGLGGFFLLGDETNVSFLHGLDRFVHRHLDNGLFEVAGMHEGWNAVIERRYARKRMMKSTQLIYKWYEQSRQEGIHAQADGPADSVQVVRLTAALLGSVRMKDLEFVESELLGFWGSLHQFMAHGVAYCAMQEERIVSICYSGFAAGNTHTLGVKTLEPFRKQGLSYSTAKACIEELRSRQLSPYWDCSPCNEASWRLAEKLGFRRTGEYNLYSIAK
ncbi:GNAT family N-acetyltransferase [Paenibacillus lycopersici]|uniref:GNAT family N-acetyltransferase n=1 Tax=Paenibacillus lycopersici TaxID=2704462 RepID=A0A6C0FV59_9BACL|nr:GNAT family N-acetyltransferase [Paenibacillus lycopersici]QHT61016.1 GNAT family N-acetyltransferase [Paenibacillus lycopersici]